MQIVFTTKARKDLDFWIKSGNKNILSKIANLIEDIQLHPFEGIGKPEPLKHKYAGFWSRRIDEEHRLIYKFLEDEIQIIKCRHHYD